MQSTLVGEVDSKLGVGSSVVILFFEDGGEVEGSWVSFYCWLGGE